MNNTVTDDNANSAAETFPNVMEKIKCRCIAILWQADEVIYSSIAAIDSSVALNNSIFDRHDATSEPTENENHKKQKQRTQSLHQLLERLPLPSVDERHSFRKEESPTLKQEGRAQPALLFDPKVNENEKETLQRVRQPCWR